MNRGMAFETLAIIAIVILVLVAVTVFFTVGMQRLGSQFVGATPQGASLSNAQSQCRTHCLALNNLLSKTENARTQPYCTSVFKLTEDGNANDDDKCYDEIITVGTPCAVTLTNGQQTTITRQDCVGGTGSSQVLG